MLTRRRAWICQSKVLLFICQCLHPGRFVKFVKAAAPSTKTSSGLEVAAASAVFVVALVAWLIMARFVKLTLSLHVEDSHGIGIFILASGGVVCACLLIHSGELGLKSHDHHQRSSSHASHQTLFVCYPQRSGPAQRVQHSFLGPRRARG